MNAPVIEFNKGNSPCLKPHLDSLGAYSPNTPYINLTAETKNAIDFGTLYHHQSPNPAWFELACFQRWFVLHDYARERGINAFWTFDWDTLIFTDLSKEPPPVRDMSTPLQPFYCNSLDALKEFLVWITWIYCDAKNFAEFKDWPVVSDLTLGIHWAQKRGIVALETLNDIVDGSTWDHNLASHSGRFVIDNADKPVEFHTKRLQFRNGFPYALALDGQWVRLKTIHCWGSHKKRMREYLDKAIASKEVC